MSFGFSSDFPWNQAFSFRNLILYSSWINDVTMHTYSIANMLVFSHISLLFFLYKGLRLPCKTGPS